MFLNFSAVLERYLSFCIKNASLGNSIDYLINRKKPWLIQKETVLAKC